MWCFGALLYNLCTGRQLFEVDPREEVLLDELKKKKIGVTKFVKKSSKHFCQKSKTGLF